MIQVLLCSADSKLRSILAPALGPDFYLKSELHPNRVKESLSSGNCDVVILDLDSNQELFHEQVGFFYSVKDSELAVVILADDTRRSEAIDMVQDGAHAYCRKPPAMRELKPIIRRAYEHIAMKRELRGKRDRVGGQEESAPSCDSESFVGDSSQMQAVYELIDRVAKLNTPVLITGESGTGKELIAQAIHKRGDRSRAPFVAVSCGAIPETLIESELFGHEKGAFTGTAGVRVGHFEQAGNGTLFLDEIGELSAQTQVKLLRVLQQREFTRLGSNRPIPLRARILFATHRDLNAMVAENKFRLDLYYRINVMTIEAPALAERPEDIAPLAGHFLKKYSEICCKEVTTISHAAMLALEQYDWPGNVRELENVIQGAIIRADKSFLELEDLPRALQSADLNADENCAKAGSFEALLREYKIKLAFKAIEYCNGNKTMAARSLDISRAYLHRLIRSSNVQAIDAA